MKSGVCSLGSLKGEEDGEGQDRTRREGEMKSQDERARVIYPFSMNSSTCAKRTESQQGLQEGKRRLDERATRSSVRREEASEPPSPRSTSSDRLSERFRMMFSVVYSGNTRSPESTFDRLNRNESESVSICFRLEAKLPSQNSQHTLSYTPEPYVPSPCPSLP